MNNYCDRNELWQTESLKQALSQANVVIAGMGGLGWVVGSSLIGLGVKELHIFDPDAIEAVNFNRLWGCGMPHVGQPKVTVFKTLAESVDDSVTIHPYETAIPNQTFQSRDMVIREGYVAPISAEDIDPTQEETPQTGLIGDTVPSSNDNRRRQKPILELYKDLDKVR